MRVDEAFVESLTVAMALAPGVYSRNRMYHLFQQPGVQRAKFRAAMLRGLVKQLKSATCIALTDDGNHHVLRYEVPTLSLSRVAQLSRVELATLRVLLDRAAVKVLAVESGDRQLVDTTLARLVEGGGDPAAIAQAASGSESAE